MEKVFRPVLGITMGDPAGVGPETVIRALEKPSLFDLCRPMAVGDPGIFSRAAKVLHSPLQIHPVHTVDECLFVPGVLDVYALPSINPKDFVPGQESAACGEAAFQAVTTVIRLAMDRKIDATVTAPINKAALHLAGHRYSGHTEIYADKTGSRHYTMLLVHGNLRVVHVSTHVSLREACERCTRERVLEVIHLAQKACRQMGIPQPRIGVAGLNPHAGEEGLFGREEIDEIAPAVAAACKEGLMVEGPLPPDSIYPKAISGFYDIVVAMYHDQGHIPIKCVGFSWNQGENASINGINITLGLPVIRVSVDHGTAFDIAWQNKADPSSLLEAIDYATRMAKARSTVPEG